MPRPATLPAHELARLSSEEGTVYSALHDLYDALDSLTDLTLDDDVAEARKAAFSTAAMHVEDAIEILEAK